MKNPEPEDEYSQGYQPISGSSRRDPEGGRVTYYYVAHHAPQQAPQARSYGTNQENSQHPPLVDPSTRPYQSPHSIHGSQHVSQDDVAGQGSSNSDGQPKPPPTYAEAVKGDNKVQTDD